MKCRIKQANKYLWPDNTALIQLLHQTGKQVPVARQHGSHSTAASNRQTSTCGQTTWLSFNCCIKQANKYLWPDNTAHTQMLHQTGKQLEMKGGLGKPDTEKGESRGKKRKEGTAWGCTQLPFIKQSMMGWGGGGGGVKQTNLCVHQIRNPMESLNSLWTRGSFFLPGQKV